MLKLPEDKQLSKEEAFYGSSLIWLEGAIAEFLSSLEMLRRYQTFWGERDPIEHCKARIKSADSMKKKLCMRQLPVTAEAALQQVYDAAGVRIVCQFVDDIYVVADLIRRMSDLDVVTEKDYIKNPKASGYRSYHMVVQIPLRFVEEAKKVYLEIQLRTIAMDCWASLEHQLKYKQSIDHENMIVHELKRCADEIASADLSLQTIQDLIAGI